MEKKYIFISLFVFLVKILIFSDNNFINLTVRTKDGIVLINGSEEDISKVKEALSIEGKSLSSIEVVSLIDGKKLSDIYDIQFYRDVSIEPGKKPEIIIKTSVYDAVNAGYIPNILNLSYGGAFLLLNSEGWEFGILGDSPNGNFSVPENIVLYSAPSIFNDSKIMIGGKDYSKGEMGYNFAVMDKNGKVIRIAGYKVSDNVGESENMGEFLKSIKDDEILLGSLKWGAVNFFSSSAAKTMMNYGIKYIPDTRTHHSDVFILGKSGILEESKLDFPSSLTIFRDDTYFESEDKITSLSGIGTVIISGTKPDDLVYICGKVE